jgi:hypothetical protein
MQKRPYAAGCTFAALEDGRPRAQRNGYLSLRSLKRPQTLIWICLAIVATFAYVRLGRQQPPLTLDPQEPSQTPPPLLNEADLKQAAELRAGLEAGWKKPRQKTVQQNVQEVAVGLQDADIYTGRPSPSAHEDISIRCQVSDICDAVPGSTCQHGSDGLGCVRSPVQRREAVKSAIKWTWQGYKRCAWGKDELHPVSCTDGSWVGLALTMVDGLDTLMLAGLDQVCKHNGTRFPAPFVCCIQYAQVSVRTETAIEKLCLVRSIGESSPRGSCWYSIKCSLCVP